MQVEFLERLQEIEQKIYTEAGTEFKFEFTEAAWRHFI